MSSPQFYRSLFLSKAETYRWAHREGSCWPGSFLSERSLAVQVAINGDLIDVLIDRGEGDQDCPSHELKAIIDDHISFPNRSES